jgi:hypothetical protein
MLILALATSARGATVRDEIPFQRRDGLIYISAHVPNSSTPLSFLVDSGAQVSILNRSIAQKLGVKSGAIANVLGVGSSTTGYWTTLSGVRAGQLNLPRDYLVLDLAQLSASCTNTPIDGILGSDFFRDRVVQIDYQEQVLRILPNAVAKAGTEILPLKIRRCGMLVPVKINGGKTQWVRLDTGCASVLQWVSGETRPEGCTERIAVALTSLSLFVTTTDLSLGSLLYRQVPTDLHPREIFPGEKGLLGNGLLSRFNTVTIDSKKKRVLLQK